MSQENLERLRAELGFEVTLLVDLQGNILAGARSDDAPPEALAALLNFAKRIINHPGDVSELAKRGESAFFDWEGQQVVCRWLPGPDPRLLVILAPSGKPYKRALSRLAKALSSE